MSRSVLAVIGAVLLVLVTGCSAPEPVQDQASTTQFPSGSTMSQLQQAATVRIGIQTDQPGLGFLPPGEQVPTGFDIDIAKIIVSGLGLGPEQIEWVDVGSHSREARLRDGSVDLVVASFPITDSRRALIGQAGPYFVTGQQMMVRAEDSSISRPEDLEGKTVCSVTGSSSGEFVHQEYGAIPSAYTSYQPCVTALLDGKLDAVSTDGAILLGFWEEHPEELKIVGEPFTTERYGIGYRHGDMAMCEFITDMLVASYESGAWRTAYETHLGIEGVHPPPAPRPDACAVNSTSSVAPNS